VQALRDGRLGDRQALRGALETAFLDDRGQAFEELGSNSVHVRFFAGGSGKK
jgi:hypothetical protein